MGQLLQMCGNAGAPIARPPARPPCRYCLSYVPFAQAMVLRFFGREVQEG